MTPAYLSVLARKRDAPFNDLVLTPGAAELEGTVTGNAIGIVPAWPSQRRLRPRPSPAPVIAALLCRDGEEEALRDRSRRRRAGGGDVVEHPLEHPRSSARLPLVPLRQPARRAPLGGTGRRGANDALSMDRRSHKPADVCRSRISEREIAVEPQLNGRPCSQQANRKRSFRIPPKSLHFRRCRATEMPSPIGSNDSLWRWQGGCRSDRYA